LNFKLSPQFPRNVQHVAVLGFMFAVVLGGTNIRVVSLAAHEIFIAFGIASLLIICSRRLRDSNLLISEVDLGWLALLICMGLAVALAPFPRRSLELWWLTYGIQLPMAYATLYLLRRGWPQRAIYRGLLLVGGYLFFLGVLYTASWVVQALGARGSGLPLPAFRLWGVLDNPSILAMFIAVAVPAVVGHLLMGVRLLERLICWLWLLGAAVTTLANGTRSGAIAAVLGVVTAIGLGLLAHPKQPLAVFQRWAKENKARATVLSVISAGMFLGAIAVMLYIQTGALGHATVDDRLELYRTALNAFSQRPLSGFGPAGFMLVQQQLHSTPPFLLVTHAHNLFLNTLADGGIIGLIGLLAFLLIAARVCFMAWKTQPEHRLLLTGAIGGLVGFLADGFFEFPMNQQGVFFTAGALLMLVTSVRPAPTKVPNWRVALVLVPSVLVVLLSIALFIPYSALWRVTYNDSVMLDGDPAKVRRGAEELDSVSRIDLSDPLITLQAAYAWARVVAISDTSDPVALTNAIQRLERGIQLDPYFAVHYLNLSMLYERAGRHEDALQMARQATQRAAQDPAAWLNLALQLEAAGDAENAEAAYIKAATFNSEWRGSNFWKSSSIRQAAQLKFRTLPLPVDQSYTNLITAGDTARRSGHSDDAKRHYQAALEMTNDPYQTALAKGLLALTREDLAGARQLLTQAANVGGLSHYGATAWAYVGDIARIQGDKDGMIDAYGKVYQIVTSRGIEGLGTARSIAYSFNSFGRFGLVSDYLGDVVMLDVLPEYVPRLKILAATLISDGAPDTAVDIYRAILKSNPDDAEARAALQMPNP
jgi:O-antigen ligase/tetratricopeptide (TPR) repeat protein